MNTQIIGTKLKRRRKNKKMTQKQLAELSGVAQSTISYLESGRLKRAPSADALFRMARVLEVEFEYFFDQNRMANFKTRGNMLLDQDEIMNKTPFYQNDSEFINSYFNEGDASEYKYFANYLNVDFGIYVSDNAMFPHLIEGDRVFVSKIREVTPGKTGFFLYNSKCYIRQFSEGVDNFILKAINPDYPEITIEKRESAKLLKFGEILFFVRYDDESDSYLALRNYQNMFLSL